MPVTCETSKQNIGHVATMVLSGTHGPLLFQVIREGLGSLRRLGARGTTRLTLQLRLALEPECLKYRANHRGDWIHGDGTELWEHSSCLWVQITGVEANSSLPDDQCDRCDFACQAQPCHLGPYSFADLSSVKLLERPALDGGNC